MANQRTNAVICALLVVGMIGAAVVANPGAATLAMKGVNGHLSKLLGKGSRKVAVVRSENSKAMPEAARILHTQLANLQEVTDDPKKLTLHSSLGHVYQDTGDWPEAIEQYSRARDLAVQLGDTEQIVATKTTLGNAYLNAGRLMEAKKELEAAFLLMDRSGPNAFATMRALGNVRRDFGKIDEALELYAAARKHHEGASAENMAGLESDIGQAYHSRGELDEAIMHYNQALKQHIALGERMGKGTGAAMELSASYNHLGQALHDKGDVEHAEENYRKALRVQQKQLPKDHPCIAETLLNIVRAQRDTGLGSDAALKTLEWAEKLLQGREFGREYVGVLTIKGDLLREKEQFEEALSFARKALKILENIVGSEETPDMAITLNGLGSILHDQQNYQDAAKNYMHALTINLKTVGTNHPETAITYNNLGNVYQDVGDDASAEKYYVKCLEIQKKIYGNVNPELSATYNNIATILVRQGRLGEAEGFVSKAIDIAQASGIPPESPERKIYEENMKEIRTKLADGGKAAETQPAPEASASVAKNTVVRTE